MNLNKDPSSWARVTPDAVLSGSEAQRANVLKMAVDDIGKQDAEIARLQAAKREALKVADERSAENCKLRQENERLRAALSEIAEPIRAFQRRAKAEGTQLNGPMVMEIVRDPNHYRGIAKRALEQ